MERVAVVKGIPRRPTLSTDEIDEQRQEHSAYEYLCHLEEARIWIKTYTEEDLPLLAEFEERLRNGVYLAKVGYCIAPHIIPLKKIYDCNQEIYNTVGLRYNHTDNINHWMSAMRAIGFPNFFYPNTIDVYEKKNMPKVIYCIHALSMFLTRYGQGIEIVDLFGKIKFSKEEINTVRQEFKKYGIQLPAFGKIGCILAKEIPLGNDSFHTAIIAINIAIHKQNLQCLLKSFKNPDVKFNIIDGNVEVYQSSLYKTKVKKLLEARNNPDYSVPTLYDILLTFEEISNCIDKSNFYVQLKMLRDAVYGNDVSCMEIILRDSALQLPNFMSDNLETYLKCFKEAFDKSDEISLFDVADIVSKANDEVIKLEEINVSNFLCELNGALENGDYEKSFNVVNSNILMIIDHEFWKVFYHSNLSKLKYDVGAKLSISDVKSNVLLSTAILNIYKAIVEGNVEELYEALLNFKTFQPEIDINVDKKQAYFSAFKYCLLRKSTEFPFLTVEEIKVCIQEIEAKMNSEASHNNIIEKINSVIFEGSPDTLLKLMLHPDSMILCIKQKYIFLYQNMLQTLKLKCEHLSHGDIQHQINLANELVYEAELQCSIISDINSAIDEGDANNLMEGLKSFVKSNDICLRCSGKYLTFLTQTKNTKESVWIEYNVADLAMYFNIHTLEKMWSKPEMGGFCLRESDITKAISFIQKECQCMEYQVLEPFVLNLQAFVRGYLIRKNVTMRKNYLSKCFTSDHFKAALKIQSFFKMVVARRQYLQNKQKQVQFENAARTIQKFWQNFKIKNNLKMLTHNPNPPLSLIQYIIHLLEISNDDYSDEFKLHTLQGKVVQTIRHNQQMEKEVYDMDIKIGLLVRNHITLEELISHKLKVRKKENSDENNTELGLDCLMQTKSQVLFREDSNMLLTAYENLLYLLQTQPVYFAKLIVSLSASQATMFVESFILSLYNYGSTPREEYLVLKLFSIALEEEINLNVDKITDIISGNQFVIKFIISYHRKGQSQDCLKKLLLPLIKTVFDDKMVVNSMNPIEIYKIWLNEVEANTGVKSELPYEVTSIEALYQKVVNARFNLTVENLLKHSLKFCEVILNSKKCIPYGMLYATRTIKLSLMKKFPNIHKNEVLKVVGNFLYYRYINPAISSPDIFNILDLKQEQYLDDNDRWKLSSIAKFLQFAATGQTYSVESEHMMCLNPYLKDCHEKFLMFFEEATEVENLENHFNIDLYSEALLMIPPVVYLTVKELYDMHQLLLEKEQDLAPDSNDVIHEVLEVLGSSTIKQIFTSNDEEIDQTELCLTLKNRYPFQIDSETDLYKIYVETKFMLITLLQIRSNQNSLTKLLKQEVTPDEELQYEIVCFSNYKETDITRLWMKKLKNWKTLTAFQQALHYNLNILELEGYVSDKNDYQDLLNDVAKDIVYRWKYRVSRKEEILKLNETQKQLDLKTLYFYEKLDYYNKYVQACLENLEVGRKNMQHFLSKRNTFSRQIKQRRALKYSGTKLHEKGILLEIKDLDNCQFKNVCFEIKPAEEAGLFIIDAKFLGVHLESVEIYIQDLLNLQYQGVAVMDMFDRAKININLLLFLINTKFYKKNL